MIHRRLPSSFMRRAITLASLCALVAATAAGMQARAQGQSHAQSHAQTQAQAKEAAPAGKYEVAMTVNIHGQTTTPRLVVGRERAFAVAGEAAGKPWRVEFTLDRLGDSGQVRLAGRITDGGTIVAAPVLVGSLGHRVAVQTSDDVRVALIVREI